jgi:hypothetical protein
MLYQPLRIQILDYLFARLTNAVYSWDTPLFTDTDYNRIIVIKDKIYPHATLKINYTTYDLHRQQDSLKSYLHILPKEKGVKSGHSPRSFIMLASEETGKDRGYHPFWYAQVLGIFHVNARLVGEPRDATKRIHFLWVKWFGHCKEHKNGAPPRGLYKVGPTRGKFVSTGIIDPEDVIRAAHLIPSFKDGRDDIEIWEPSVIEDSEGDWMHYYVNKYVSFNPYPPFRNKYQTRFVDRDMVMRSHLEGGVGHIDPAQYAKHCGLDPLDSSGDQSIICEEVSGVDSDECSSLPDEAIDAIETDDEGNDTESFEIVTSSEDTSFNESD